MTRSIELSKGKLENGGASNQTWSFYPDLIAAGSLEAAFSNAFAALGSTLIALGFDDDVTFVTYCRVERANRFSQIYIAANERLFLCDFWRDGVCFAHASTPDIAEAARAIDSWVAAQCTLDILAGHPRVSLSKSAMAFDKGNETEERWTSYELSIAEDFPELAEFVDIASKIPKLRQLFPYTSLNRFCFSRCTGYPFTYDMPFVQPQLDGSYNVHGCDGAVVGAGDASTAVHLVIANLPPNCGPAMRGTSETIDVPR